MGIQRAMIEPLEPRRLLTQGTFDAFFGDGGNAQANFFNTTDVRFVAGIPGGKVIAVGQISRVDDFITERFFTAQFNPDGSLDATYGGGDGATFEELPGGDVFFTGAALQPDQKLLVAGTYVGQIHGVPADAAPIVVRYMPDGTLDPTFGDGGVAMMSNFDVPAGAPVVLSSGIIAVPMNGDGNGARTGAGIFWLKADGTPDGFASETFDSFYDSDRLEFRFYRAGPLVPLPDGSIVIAGTKQTGREDEFPTFFQSLYLIKFDLNRNLDTTFGQTGDGISDFTHFGGEEVPRSAILGTDGSIIVSTDFSPHQVAMSKFFTSGHLDESFGDQGTTHVVIDKLAGRSEPSNVIQQADGKLILAGATASFPHQSIAKLMRFNADGTIDPTFGNRGTTKFAIDLNLAPPLAIGFGVDGAILMARAAGDQSDDDQHMVVSRFWRDESPAATYVPRNRFTASTTALRFTIAWRDEFVVDEGSIDNSDLLISSPTGERLRAYVESKSLIDGELVVTYKIKPPGGAWDSADNGRYTVKLLSNRVADIGGHFAQGRTLGGFRVRI